ncbi:DUF2510 domain-containing protein [Agromyces bauzanensis]
MTTELRGSAVPGWYEDPDAPDVLRWWDGAYWSDHEFRPMPPGGWRTNEIGDRARTLSFWAIGVGIALWLVPIGLTFLPSAEVQAIGIILAWVGFLPTLTLSILAIVFGGIGLSRARKPTGLRRREALTGLIGGICTIVAPPALAIITVAVFMVIGALNG